MVQNQLFGAIPEKKGGDNVSDILYKKDQWLISIDQLMEWEQLLAVDKDMQTVIEQIRDILNQC